MKILEMEMPLKIRAYDVDAMGYEIFQGEKTHCIGNQTGVLSQYEDRPPHKDARGFVSTV